MSRVNINDRLNSMEGARTQSIQSSFTVQRSKLASTDNAIPHVYKPHNKRGTLAPNGGPSRYALGSDILNPSVNEQAFLLEDSIYSIKTGGVTGKISKKSVKPYLENLTGTSIRGGGARGTSNSPASHSGIDYSILRG